MTTRRRRSARVPDAAKLIHFVGSKVIHPEPANTTPSGSELEA